jgi:hypothetical protein
MRFEAGAIVRPEPLAYFLTWTTYGSWLPGDARGWTDSRGVIRQPNARLVRAARRLARKPVVVFDAHGRKIVEQVIGEHCLFRRWLLHAVSCRTMHVHAVVSAAETSPDTVLAGLKARCARKLSEMFAGDGPWWAKGGSRRRLYDLRGLQTVVAYVLEAQEHPRT